MCLEGKVTGSRRKLNTSQENGDQGSSTAKRVHSTCLCFHGCNQLVCQPRALSLKELNHTTFVAVLSSQMNCLLCLEGKVTGSRRKLNTSQENGDQGSSTTKRVHSTCLCFHGCYQLVCQPFSLKELNHTTFVAVLSSQMNCFLYGKIVITSLGQWRPHFAHFVCLQTIFTVLVAKPPCRLGRNTPTWKANV